MLFSFFPCLAAFIFFRSLDNDGGDDDIGELVTVVTEQEIIDDTHDNETTDK